jgi:hypothetical protein
LEPELTDSVANQKYIGNQKSQVLHFALIVLMAGATLALGDYVFLTFRGQSEAAAIGPIQFRVSAGGGAADVFVPPRSMPAAARFTAPSHGRAGPDLAQYTSRAAPEEVLRFYRTGMPRLGWTERELPRGASDREGLAVLWYSNAAGDSCIIAVSTRPAAETAVTVLRMPPSGAR